MSATPWFTDSLVQLRERSRLLAVLYGEGPRPLGSGVRFLAVGYVDRIRAGVGGVLGGVVLLSVLGAQGIADRG